MSQRNDLTRIGPVDQNGVRGTDDRLAILKDVPGKPQPRLKVPRILIVGITGSTVGADLRQGGRSWFEYYEAVLGFAWCSVPIVPKPQFKHKIWLDLVAVLNEGAQLIYKDAASAIGWIRCKGVRLVINKCSDAGETEQSRRVRIVVVVMPPKFSAEFDRVLSVNPTHGVRNDGGVIASELRLPAIAAKFERS